MCCNFKFPHEDFRTFNKHLLNNLASGLSGELFLCYAVTAGRLMSEMGGTSIIEKSIIVWLNGGSTSERSAIASQMRSLCAGGDSAPWNLI
jgi:hypothetical protein